MLDAYEVTPDAAADLVRFLASGKAETQLSGHYFSVDEDVNEVASRAQQMQRNNLYLLRMTIGTNNSGSRRVVPQDVASPVRTARVVTVTLPRAAYKS